MRRYAFWNNKGGTGKTSLAFQALSQFAYENDSMKILAIDGCPQANLSELLLGGLVGNGGANLLRLHEFSPRKSIGGYFQSRLPSPFLSPTIDSNDFISKPHEYNPKIPENIDLIAGDPLLELQSNAMATLANAQVPGTNTWLAVIRWLHDFLNKVQDEYDYVFIDANPSFSIYTQIALSTADFLIVPVMADDSSRRALQNVFSLIYGYSLPSPIYTEHAFARKLKEAGCELPRIHLIAKNRITRYMGPASAYYSVLKSIDDVVLDAMHDSPQNFSFDNLEKEGVAEIRDFGTTGVVAFAEGVPFFNLKTGTHYIMGEDVQIRQDYIRDCIDAVKSVSDKIN